MENPITVEQLNQYREIVATRGVEGAKEVYQLLYSQGYNYAGWAYGVASGETLTGNYALDYLAGSAMMGLGGDSCRNLSDTEISKIRQDMATGYLDSLLTIAHDNGNILDRDIKFDEAREFHEIAFNKNDLTNDNWTLEIPMELMRAEFGDAMVESVWQKLLSTGGDGFDSLARTTLEITSYMMKKSYIDDNLDAMAWADIVGHDVNRLLQIIWQLNEEEFNSFIDSFYPSPLPPELPPPPPRDPLALDLNDDGIVKTLSMSRGVHFDLDNSGFAERTSWVAPEDGLLVLDRNNNNFIDGGAELFGTETLLSNGKYAKNGFEALAEFDVNQDGAVDANDTVYSSLRVWRDSNSNGVVDSGELKTLSELDIKSIATAYINIDSLDANNVDHREAGTFTYNNATQSITNTLWFESDRRISVPVTELQGNAPISDVIKRLPNAIGFGNTYSLHQAMAIDASGELQKKVQRFSVELNPEKRRELLREILVLWTGTEGVVAGSRGNQVDATSLSIMESFWGQPALQDKPIGAYASSVNEAYVHLEQSVYSQLMASTHMRDLLGLSNFTEFNGSWTADYSVVVDLIFDDLLSGNEFAQNRLIEFVEVIRGFNPSSNEIIAPLVNTIVGNASVLSADQRDTILNTLYAENLILRNVTSGGAIAGDNADNLIYGSAASDQVNGNSGRDILIGEDGNDALYGMDDEDHLIGGIGSDSLIGGAGDDAYYYRLGDGNDQINDSAGIDEIYFGEGISPNEINLARQGWYGLKISFKDGGTILINNMFNSADDVGTNAIERIRFSNNEFWNLAQIKAKIIQDSISEGNDIVEGFASNDVIESGGGFDQLRGLGGDDRYVFNRGDGVDIITDTGGNDTLVFGPGIVPTDVVVHQSNGNFYFILNNGEMIQITGSIVDGSPAEATLLERVEFSGGVIWDKTIIQQKITETLANPNLLMGRNTWDHLIAGNSNSIVVGLDGDDQIYGGNGNDTLIGGGGLNFLDGGNGDDTYLFTEQPAINFIEKFRNGFDRILFAEGITPEDVTVKLIPGRQESYLQDGVLWVYSISQANNWNFEIKVGDTVVYLDSLLTSGALFGAQVKDPLLPSGEIEFFNGTKWSVNDLLQQAVKGSTVGDYITGSGNGDVINGLAGNDTVLALGGADTLDGGDGDDTLTGGYGNDLLIGGRGNDLLRGDNSFSEGTNLDNPEVDVYRFNRGDGNDTIEDYFGRDIIEFGAGIAKEQVVLSTVDDHTVVSFVDSTDTITIKYGALAETEFYNGGRIEIFKFASGDEWNFDLRNSPVLKEGGEGDDRLTGGYGNDTLIGHGGNDSLRGDLGDDSYHYNLGDGLDYITDVGGFDRIILGDSVTPDMVKLRNSWSQGLIVSINGIDVLSYNDGISQSNLDFALEQIIFSSVNVVWDQATFFSKALESTSGNDEIYGVLNSEIVDGGAGNDRIETNAGNDILIGGTGDDYLGGGTGDDVYRFSLGDGSDYISDEGGRDTIEFLNGVLPSDISIQRTETDLVLKVKNANPITLSRFFNSDSIRAVNESSAIENIIFANGEAWSLGQILSKLSNVGTSSANTLYGTDASELIDAKEGNDTVFAGGGNDSLIGGSGNDTLYGEAGDDLLQGGDSDDQLYDFYGNNIFVGGKGKDHIFLDNGSEGQGVGATTIRYALGDGTDYIYSSNLLSNTRIELGAGITRDMVYLKSQGEYKGGFSYQHEGGYDLYIKGTTDQLVGLIDNEHFEIAFANGDVLKGAELKAQISKSIARLSADRQLIVGKAEPGAKLLVSYRNQDNSFNHYSELSADHEGNYIFDFGFGIKDVSRIAVSIKDSSGYILPITVLNPTIDTSTPPSPIVELDSSGYVITGFARPGTYVSASTPGRYVGEIYSDLITGAFTIVSPTRLNNGENISVVASVNALIKSASKIITAPDAASPLTPSGIFDNLGTSLSGSAEKGSTISITNLSGNILGSSVANAETGAFAINFAQPIANGELVQMVARDTAGNFSTRYVRARDLTAPTTIYAAVDKTRGVIKGFAEPGATVIVRDTQGGLLTEILASAIDGSFDVTLGNALANGQVVNIKVIDTAGNASAIIPVTVGASNTPVQPQAAIDSQGRVVSGVSEQAGTIILRTKDNIEIARTTVHAGESFSITLANSYVNKEILSASLQIAGGVESVPNYFIAPDKMAPAKPFAIFNDYNSEITGFAEPQSTVQILNEDNAVVASVIASGTDGSFVIHPGFAVSGTTRLSVVSIDSNGNVSSALALTPNDRFAPVAPTASFNSTGKVISGNAEPDTLVFVEKYIFGNSNQPVVGYTRADQHGVWSIELAEAIMDGSEVHVTSVDAGNNRSFVSIDSPDLTAPLPATAQFDSTGKYISGEAEWTELGGNQIIVMDSTNSSVLGSAILGAYSSSYRITLATALKNNEVINIIVKDVAGNSSTPTKINAPDKTPPAVPTASFDTVGKIVTGIAEPGSTVVVKNSSGVELKTAVAHETTGAYSITLNTALINKETVNVTAKDAAGNISAVKAIIAPDLTAPAIPSASIDTAGKLITGNAEKGSTVIVRDAAGVELKSAAANASTGAYTITLTTALINKETVNVTAKDAAGNISAIKSIVAPDKTAPSAPTASFDTAGLVITGVAEAGSIVSVKNTGGTELKTATANATTGAYTITLTTALINKETVNVTAKDAAGNISAIKAIVAPDKTPPAAPTANIDTTRKVISGIAEAGSVVEVKTTTGSALGNITAHTTTGAYSITLAIALTLNQTVNVTAKDAAGNVSAIKSLIASGTASSMFAATALTSNRDAQSTLVANADQLYVDKNALLVQAMASFSPEGGIDTRYRAVHVDQPAFALAVGS